MCQQVQEWTRGSVIVGQQLQLADVVISMTGHISRSAIHWLHNGLFFLSFSSLYFSRLPTRSSSRSLSLSHARTHTRLNVEPSNSPWQLVLVIYNDMRVSLNDTLEDRMMEDGGWSRELARLQGDSANATSGTWFLINPENSETLYLTPSVITSYDTVITMS